MSDPRGATPAEWFHFDFELGLSGHLLPVVCDPNPTPAPGSKIKKWGKVPSAYNAQGEAHGIKDWQTRPILPNELQLWRKDPRLGICVRTGSASGVYAIDVDIEDETLSDTVYSLLPLSQDRSRGNSNKFLFAFTIPEKPALDKRIINTKHGRIEFLADGQQFLAAGTHTSGERYTWGAGHSGPKVLRSLSVAEFESLWSKLQQFSKEVMPNVPSVSRPLAQTNVVPGVASGDNTLLTEIDDETQERLESALEHPKMLADGVDNDFWSEIGYALLTLKGLGYALFNHYSIQAPNFDPQAVKDWWQTHEGQTPRTDYRHIFTLARARGWGAAAATATFAVLDERVGENVGEQSQDPADYELPPPPPREQIKMQRGIYPDLIRQIEKTIGPEVYKQSGALIRIGRADELADGIQRDSNTRALVELTSAYLRSMVGDMADIFSYDRKEKDWVIDDLPEKLAESTLRMKDWPSIRPLDAIARAPFVRINGTVCDRPGYDAPSRMFYMPNANFPKLPETITKDDAQAALDKLLEPFQEFPYATVASRAAFAAHVLTEAARAAIRTSPMFWYSAPDAGTGKTLLCDVPSSIVHGVLSAHRPWVSDADELRKSLFSSLVAGDRSIMFDNIPTGYKVRTAELCAFITSPVWKDRRLGASEMVEIPNKSVLSATGNNVNPVSDMARRSIVIRLDANSDKMKQRRFKIEDLPEYIKQHRVELLMAALTVIAGWQQNRAPGMPPPLPSFEDWSRMVRDPLLWLGMPDPVDTQEEETDDESGSFQKAFAALGAHFAGREFAAPSVVNACQLLADTAGDVAKLLVEAGCSHPMDTTKVGYWLRECRDKRGGGYKLLRVKSDGKHATKWLLQPTVSNEDLV